MTKRKIPEVFIPEAFSAKTAKQVLEAKENVQVSLTEYEASFTRAYLIERVADHLARNAERAKTVTGKEKNKYVLSLIMRVIDKLER